MYQCDECDRYFQQPQIEYESRDPMGECDSSFTEKFEVCPYCESLDFTFISEEKDI
jgi:hypothetical protein